MTIYKRLAEARVKLQEAEIKKSGENKFAKFKYFELADFLPIINKINNDLGLITMFSFDSDRAKLEVISCEDGSKMEFSIPSCRAELKGATAIQMLGAEETYLRRYLMLAAYEITDGEVIDSQEPKADNNQQDHQDDFTALWNKLTQEQKDYFSEKFPGKYGPQKDPKYFKREEKEKITEYIKKKGIA